MSTTSTGFAATDRAARYAKQLASHMGHKITTHWDPEAQRGSLSFPDGEAALHAQPDGLRMEITAESEHLPRLEKVIGIHLVRFDATRDLVVEWERADGTPGSRQDRAALAAREAEKRAAAAQQAAEQQVAEQ